MDILGTRNLADAISGHTKVVDDLLNRIFRAGWAIHSSPLIWDILSLTVCYRQSLSVAESAINSGLPWSTRFGSSLVDDAIYNRELLLGALFNAMEIGLVVDEKDANEFRYDLLKGQHEGKVVVAYVDMLGVGKELAIRNNLHLGLSRVSRFIEHLCRHNQLSSYYWRSADVFYIVGAADTEGALKPIVKKLIDLLIHIQEEKHLTSVKEGWGWQMGVSLGEGALVGDILLPSKVCDEAAKLMDNAKRPRREDGKRDGGMILIHRAVSELLDDEYPFKDLGGFEFRDEAERFQYLYDKYDQLVCYLDKNTYCAQ